MENDIDIIPVELLDGTIINVEVVSIGEQRVGYNQKPFKEATETIKKISSEIATTLKSINNDVQPNKIAVKLGLEIALESGNLTAILVKGTSKANIEITMEWNN